MDVVFVILDIILAFFCAFNAGRLSAMMDIDEIDGRKTDPYLPILKWLSIAFSIYMIIAVYGMGLRR